jgi:hypothetical protein
MPRVGLGFECRCHSRLPDSSDRSDRRAPEVGRLALRGLVDHAHAAPADLAPDSIIAEFPQRPGHWAAALAPRGRLPALARPPPRPETSRGSRRPFRAVAHRTPPRPAAHAGDAARRTPRPARRTGYSRGNRIPWASSETFSAAGHLGQYRFESLPDTELPLARRPPVQTHRVIREPVTASPLRCQLRPGTAGCSSRPGGPEAPFRRRRPGGLPETFRARAGR